MWTKNLTRIPTTFLHRTAVACTLTLAFGCGAGDSGLAEPDPAAEISDGGELAAIDHGPWAEFLDAYVWEEQDGVNKVEYAAVEPEDRQELEDYLSYLQTIPISKYPRDEQMAFWINLYNALTVDVVLDHYPVDSILDIDLTALSDGPWDAELVEVEGREVSLNDIEHEILRPTFEDPRIHYAVNCASYSCPDLVAEPFTAANLEKLLESAAREYVNHPRGAHFDDDGELVVSSIYDWYREDFGDSEEGVVEHLRKYAEGELAERLAGYSGDVEHDYDWSLNEP